MCDCVTSNLIVQSIILIILILIIFKLSRVENYVDADDTTLKYMGRGLDGNTAAFTSGATMRRLAQEFSSTNQGQYMTIHNAEIKDPALRDQTKLDVVVFPAESVPPQVLAQTMA